MDLEESENSTQITYTQDMHLQVLTYTKTAVTPFIPANIRASFSWPQLQPSHSEMRHLLALVMTSNHSVTFELMSLALEYSHLGGLVLTQRLLVQLIAICIALLVSQHCLCDISIFFSFFSLALSLWLRLVPRILGRGIRQCLVCD